MDNSLMGCDWADSVIPRHGWESRTWDGFYPLNGRIKSVRQKLSWWRHQMETFSALLAICAGNSSVTGEFPSQRPVTQNFDVLFLYTPEQTIE